MALPYRFFLLVLGRRIPCHPYGLSKITRTVEDREGAFHTRDLLSGPITFAEADFRLLYAVERSRERCAPLGFVVEKRHAGVWQERIRTTFSLSDCTFDVPRCELQVTVQPEDGYHLLYNNWQRKVNLLDCPVPRTTLTTTIDTLNLGSRDRFEFIRIDSAQEGDYSGNGWQVFLRNTSWISGSLLQKGTRNRDVLLYRLARRGVAYVLNPETNQAEPPDLSDQDFQLDEDWVPTDDTTQTADYVKTIQLAGFKPYQIGTYTDWNGKYGKELILTACGAPSPGPGYLQVTGPAPYGANNEEQTGTCLNLRRHYDDKNFKSLWWRYGAFRFTRCFPLLEGLNYVLKQTAPSLAPDDAANLSHFFTADQNAATGQGGRLNELNRLYLAAGSDIKRPGASEPATRLRLSAEELFTDVASSWDVGWFIDPATGKLRFEHRSWLEANELAPLDLREGGYLQYRYTKAKMPRVERLQVQQAASEGATYAFQEGVVTYAGACVNQQEGENESSRSVNRLTGDIRTLVLQGDRFPDDCLAVLVAAPLTAGQLTQEVENGNQALAASNLFKHYHRRGRVLRQGTLTLGGTVQFDSVRPTVQLEPATTCGPWQDVSLRRPLTTVFGVNGRLLQAEEDLATGEIAVTALHAGPESELPVPGFERAFDAAQFDAEQFA
ncbi:hypothetical protein [Hymenobacter crusticola]|uniref:Uncharacterized protein n=1 Tax=Hymenobacter crusticola TaxID=1770526 RepID=A0A243W7I8_9BACT|nr:hypothetical protein [Hymenobacter crusticola]OUJ69192.1 hypothetical protein BXP70_26760 [Hymenobacter crusticola]